METVMSEEAATKQGFTITVDRGPFEKCQSHAEKMRQFAGKHFDYVVAKDTSAEVYSILAREKKC